MFLTVWTFIVIFPKLLVSKEISHCQCLLAQTRLFALEHIPHIILTHSVHLTKTYFDMLFRLFNYSAFVPNNHITMMTFAWEISYWLLVEIFLGVPAHCSAKSRQCHHCLYVLSIGAHCITCLLPLSASLR